jgi:2',3'-cyclic-nucleotide 2'-phosphodiesterase (5'-nucleotidase family)
VILLTLLACARPDPAALADGGLPHRPILASELADTGSVRERLPAKDDANLVLLYGGEQMGSLETCGCPKRPRGSLARVEGYRQALRKARPGVPDLLLNAGNWLDDTIGTEGDSLRLDVEIADAWMVKGVEEGGWDALNVGFRDLPFLAGTAFPAGAVSASVRPEDPASGPAPYRVLQAGDLRVAVTGVSPLGMAFVQPAGWSWQDEVESVRALVPAMEKEADLVVVLAYSVGPKARELARIPGVDVVIEAGEFHERWEPSFEDSAVWVRTHFQTMRLGELRLVVRDGRVVGALDRKIDLDDAIPAAPRLLAMQKEARAEIDRAQQALFGSP